MPLPRPSESARRARPKKKSDVKIITMDPPQWPRAATSQPNTALTRFNPTDGFVHRAMDTMMSTFSKDFEQWWAMAKGRLGAANAGETVEEFVKTNTKIIPLDPWTEDFAQPGQSYKTGSMNPLTIDFVVPRVTKAPNSSPPHIVDHGIKAIIPVFDNTSMTRRGEWTYGALQITPGPRHTLKS